jgi:glycerol dehydrogenase
MLSVFSAPSHYVQGKNATAALGQEMKRLGLEGPALIVAGKSAIRLLAEVWQKYFSEAGIAHAVHEFGGECSYIEIERIKDSGRANKSRVVIGAGGGKVLDAARAAADDLNLPIVNCPTIASSDAPCSALSVIYTEEGVFQEYRFYRKNPDLVLVDTAVIAQSPPRLLVAGMGDALSTWFEARTCVEGHVRNMRGGTSTQSALAAGCFGRHRPRGALDDCRAYGRPLVFHLARSIARGARRSRRRKPGLRRRQRGGGRRL